ncbi:MAG: DUF4270 domain-containing protein [Tannerella sp.]|jgi:hypothetical protein|nr:DUF4270 domain-containing protein [Tannerella sp.]
MMITGLKRLIAACSLLTGIALGSCDDNLTAVGTSIQPPDDRISVHTDTFMMMASTIKLDSIFAKTTQCMLGEMYDPLYGTIKSDFLCQFYCREDFQFAEAPHEGKIDSVELFIMYSNDAYGRVSAYGDTLLPMEASVYPVTGVLNRSFYTKDNLEIYADMNNLLAKTMYTPYDMSITDSVRALIDSYGYYVYTPNIRIKLPAQLGQKIYDETVNNPSTFASPDRFNAFFPGLYVTNTFGSGNLIFTQGERIILRISYSVLRKDAQGQDSLAYRNEEIRSTQDVIQANRFKNDNLDHLLVENPTHTYIKAPAGVCTKLVIPTTEISKTMNIQNRFINGFTLNLKYLPADEWDFAYSPPSHLLILPEDSVQSFFENGMVENYQTSYVSFLHDANESSSSSPSATYYGYNPSTRTYSFGNISNLLKAHIKNSPEKDLSVLVLPVNRSYNTSSSYSNTVYYTDGISHTLFPSGLKIRKEAEFMKIAVISSEYENKEQ